jgi:hypothetical protein
MKYRILSWDGGVKGAALSLRAPGLELE